MGFFQNAAKKKSFKTHDGVLFLGTKADLIDLYNQFDNKEFCIKRHFVPFTTTSLPNSGLRMTCLMENGRLTYGEELVLDGKVVMDDSIRYDFLSKDENGEFKLESVTLIAESENGKEFEEETLKYEFEDEKGYHNDYILRTNLKGKILNNEKEVFDCLNQIKKLSQIKQGYQAASGNDYTINESGEIVRE